MMMLFAPLKQLTMVNAKIQAGIAAGESVFEILDAESEMDKGTKALKSDSIGFELQQYRLMALIFVNTRCKACVNISLTSGRM